MKSMTKKIMLLSMCCSISTVVISARGAAAKVVQTRECLDEDTFIPLCTNESGHASCHYGNIGNTLRWQQNALKEGLANYAEGDSHKLLRVACYLAAYARKLERGGYGYAAATNAYCAISWLQKSASRGCDEACAACYCCLGFGGSIVRHGSALWSGFPTCYSLSMHDVSALWIFEPPPDYFVGEFNGSRRYVRVYDRNMVLADEYKDKAERRLMSWHTVRMQDCVGWREPSDTVEIVQADFTGLDVRSHVVKLVKEMDAVIEKVLGREMMAIERQKKQDEEEVRRRIVQMEQEQKEREAIRNGQERKQEASRK